jgi:hypothetical protein
MLSSRFAGIPISSSIIDKAGVPQLLACRGANLESQKSGSGVRLHLGMVSGIRSEARPASFRNRCPACVGFRSDAVAKLIEPAANGAARNPGGARHRADAAAACGQGLRRGEAPPSSLIQQRIKRLKPQANGCFINHKAIL